MNIRYRFINPETGDIKTVIHTLEDLERDGLHGLHPYQIISRDIGTGSMDKTGKEGFQKDRILVDVWRTPGIIVFEHGCFAVKWDGGNGSSLLCNLAPFEIIGRSEE